MAQNDPGDPNAGAPGSQRRRIHRGGRGRTARRPGRRPAPIDEAADEAQRDALGAITSGEHGGAIFEILAAVCPHKPGPVYAPIHREVDRQARHASFRIEGIVESRIEPITNPITGEEHRAKTVLPDGFEYTEAEVGNTVAASFTVTPDLAYEVENSYAQLNAFDWSNA